MAGCPETGARGPTRCDAGPVERRDSDGSDPSVERRPIQGMMTDPSAVFGVRAQGMLGGYSRQNLAR